MQAGSRRQKRPTGTRKNSKLFPRQNKQIRIPTWYDISIPSVAEFSNCCYYTIILRRREPTRSLRSSSALLSAAAENLLEALFLDERDRDGGSSSLGDELSNSYTSISPESSSSLRSAAKSSALVETRFSLSAVSLEGSVSGGVLSKEESTVPSNSCFAAVVSID